MNFKGNFMEKSIVPNLYTHFYGESVIYPFVDLEAGKKDLYLLQRAGMGGSQEQFTKNKMDEYRITNIKLLKI